LLQSGTITATNLDLSYPSIAANAAGTVVIACNGSGPKSFVSCYAAVGQVQNGSLQFGDLVLLKSGLATYQVPDTTGSVRWGDYSATTIDPTDSTRFWMIQMYALSSVDWATQITELITGPQLAISLTANALQISWPASASGAQLELANALPALNWSAVSQLPVIVGDKAIVTLPLSDKQAYFRLRQ